MDMKPKNLLLRVLSFARGELERRARTSEPGEGEQADAEHDGEHPNLRAEAVDGSPRASEHGAAHATAAGGPSPTLPVGQRLEAVRAHAGDGLTLRWSVSEADVQRAQRLVPGKPVLCLRLVSFSKARDDVLREVQDRPGLELQGQCELAEVPQRAVIALGLRAGERFVSIAHHVL